jgi:DNA polymerase III subunit gamma/tau
VSITQVLARKWRPRSFAEIVGQEHVVKALTNALAVQRLHHAYLFTGTRGVGKTTLARVLAKALNCEQGVTETPCGRCTACMEIDAGRFVDLVEVDAATNTHVEEMRELLDGAQYMPVGGRFKVYIIDEVHMLSRFAFNSMLKTLEEPPPHVKFILATTDVQKVPVTVLSRCLQFNLRQLPLELIVARLAHVLENEALPFEPAALQMLARTAQGSMRDGLSLLDQAIALGGGRVEARGVAEMLGAIDQDYLFALLEALAANDGKALMAQAERIAERSLSFDSVLQELGALLHHMALAQIVPDALASAGADRDKIAGVAARFQPELVQLLYQIVLYGRRDLALAPDAYAGFSMTLLRMLAFSAEGVGHDGAAVSAPVESTHTAVTRGGAATETSAAPLQRNQSTAVPGQDATGPASFDGDWPALVARMNGGGMAGVLARNCEFRSCEGNQFKLVLSEENKHLLPYRDKLETALEHCLGRSVRLHITVGAVDGVSVAQLQDQATQEKQARAVAAIEQDPFVRGLIDGFGATLIESSIKPV